MGSYSDGNSAVQWSIDHFGEDFDDRVRDEHGVQSRKACPFGLLRRAFTMAIGTLRSVTPTPSRTPTRVDSGWTKAAQFRRLASEVSGRR